MAKHIPIIVLGIGQVGGAFLDQLMRVRPMLASRYDVDLLPVAITDSQGTLFDAAGLSPDTIQAALDTKSSGQALNALPDVPCNPSNLIRCAADHGVAHAIVVDTTAADGMEGPLRQALDQGYGVVMANKRPLAGPWAGAQAFFNNPRVRFEATVGAGLPVVNTLRYLVDTGDTIVRIEGALSGTLGYLCTRLEDGDAFSVVVNTAKARGYTEPDPRDDLSGMDVARKVLILGRLAGWALELDDLQVDPLYPAKMADISVEAFMEALPRLDLDFAAYMGALAGVPRYMAEISSDGGVVSLRMVGERLAAQLRGTLNQVSFWTERYTETPLTVAGPGGGKAVAASAVLEDCLQLARNVAW